MAYYNQNNSNFQTWHKRLVHVNMADLKLLKSKNDIKFNKSDL